MDEFTFGGSILGDQQNVAVMETLVFLEQLVFGREDELDCKGYQIISSACQIRSALIPLTYSNLQLLITWSINPDFSLLS